MVKRNEKDEFVFDLLEKEREKRVDKIYKTKKIKNEDVLVISVLRLNYEMGELAIEMKEIDKDIDDLDGDIDEVKQNIKKMGEQAITKRDLKVFAILLGSLIGIVELISYLK